MRRDEVWQPTWDPSRVENNKPRRLAATPKRRVISPTSMEMSLSQSVCLPCLICSNDIKMFELVYSPESVLDLEKQLNGS